MKTEFRTPIHLAQEQFSINHKTSLLLMGSCFTEHIGQLLDSHKYRTLSNPFGISYHPLAIHHQLKLENIDSIFIEESNGIHFSYDFHSQLNTLKKEEYLNKLSQQLDQLQQSLTQSDIVFITYGTAWVYELSETGKMVNNCHQQPAKQFNKRLLSVDEILSSWEETEAFIKERYGSKKVVFTISPVRHLKDGFHENQLSKATLKLAIEAICKSNGNYYFPAYEIMMDDLRDYRFYKDDLLHPNQLAIDYIWNCFEQCYFDEETKTLNRQIKKLFNAFYHKAFQPASEKHQNFIRQLIEKFKDLEELSGIDFQKETKELTTRLLSS